MTKDRTYMNGARDRMAKWHATLRRIADKLAAIQRSVNALDEDLQDRRTLAENYGMLMQIDVSFAVKFLQEVPAEVLVEALRDPALIDKLQAVIEAARK
jgi:hypothetical protein